MSAPLIADRWRTATVVTILVAALGTVLLALRVHDTAGTRFDEWALDESISTIGDRAARVLLFVSAPALSIGVIVAVAVVAGVGRRWRLLALAVVAPAVAEALTEWVLKPAIGRYLYLPGVPIPVLREMYVGAFPSGHETGVAAAAVLVLVAAGQFALRPARRAAVVCALVGWTALAATGLVRRYYHYATDTMGAVGVALVVVLGGALLIDRLAPALGRRRAGRELSGVS